jgi:hypothetical protein
MTSMAATAKELAEQFEDPAWRRKFVDLTDLVQILADCIIPNDYSIPDGMSSALVLTDAGTRMKDRLIRKERVPIKEAHLMCALTVGHDELYLNVEETDLDKLSTLIEEQLRSHRISFPFSYGRKLYDAYGRLFEDEKDVLTIDETLQLIQAVPDGVYQYGRFVIGPYGLLQSRAERHVRFSRVVPAYHCSQPTCKSVHQVRLSTGYDAPINDERKKLRRILDESVAQAADWWGLALEVDNFAGAYYADHHAATLVGLLGDAVSDEELRHLLVFLLDETKGEFCVAVADIIPSRAADKMVEGLSREKMQQVVLLANEEWISRGLDRLVHAGIIEVPRGEVRRPVTNIRNRSGAFQLTPELGHLGVRFVSDDPGFASLRERELLDRLYLRDNETDTEELDWQLRGFDSEDLDERLENFFRSTDPRSALTRMILARKTNMIAACEYVGIEDGTNLSDEVLVETVLWKLGFDVRIEHDSHGQFWDLHQRISALTQASRISGIGESETFRGVASAFFNELEGLLADALAFSTWVLLVDHTSQRFPFSYNDADDRVVALELLQAAHRSSGNIAEEFNFGSDRLELYGLIRGFEVLAKKLDAVKAQQSSLSRPTNEIPDFDGKTAIKEFVFKSRVPYLNLTEAAQDRLIKGLKSISAGLLHPVEVHQVRNDYSHYRRTSPEIERMVRALDAIRDAVKELENLGLARLLCFPAGFESDAWGRSKHRFSGPRSAEHLFARPSKFDWMGLPDLKTSQYIVRAAVFAEPNEVLRFTPRFESEFSRMWANYPARRQSGPVAGAPSEESGPHVTNVGMQSGRAAD